MCELSSMLNTVLHLTQSCHFLYFVTWDTFPPVYKLTSQNPQDYNQTIIFFSSKLYASLIKNLIIVIKLNEATKNMI